MSVVLVLKAGDPRLALLKRADNHRIIVKSPTGSDDVLVLPGRPNDFKHLALLLLQHSSGSPFSAWMPSYTMFSTCGTLFFDLH